MDKKIQKKINKLQERYNELETEIRTSLGKKTSSTAEIDVPGHTRKMAEISKEIAKLQLT